MKVIAELVSSYFFMTAVALVGGFVFADTVAPLAAYSAFLLGGIFFLSSLSLPLEELKQYGRSIGFVLGITAVMLLVFPVLVFFVTRAIYEPLSMPFLLLAAMPAGMTAPFLASVAGGRQSLALVLTVVTSLIAPLSVPLVVKTLAGASVTVSFGEMATSLALIIFTPFVLAQAVRFLAPHIARKLVGFGKPVSLALLALLVAGIVGNQAGMIATVNWGSIVLILGALFVMFLLFQAVGFWGAWWRAYDERVSVSVSLTYMNFTLALYLADRFFSDALTTTTIVLAIIPWVLFLSIFRRTIELLGYRTIRKN